MFNYKIVYKLKGVDYNATVKVNSENDALSLIFELHPDATSVRLWRDNVVAIPLLPALDNVIYVDFKAKRRLA